MIFSGNVLLNSGINSIFGGFFCYSISEKKLHFPGIVKLSPLNRLSALIL